MNDRPGRTPPAEPGVRVPRTSCGRPNAQPCEPSSAWLREVLSQQTVCPILHSLSSEFISHHIIGFVSQGPYIELSLAVLPSPRSRTELTRGIGLASRPRHHEHQQTPVLRPQGQSR